MPAGRPTLYQREYHNPKVFKLCLLGATDKEIADFFEIAESTLNLWKEEHPEFMESIKKGKIEADANVSKSLYKKAIGFTKKDCEKVFQYDGQVIRATIKEYFPPDTAAINIWLKNRRGKVNEGEGAQRWADKQESEINLGKSFIDFLKEAQVVNGSGKNT